jgi:hypothetical protein
VRSEQVHSALAQGNSRFQICGFVSKGVRLTHAKGTRMADSIGDVLDHLSLVVVPHLPFVPALPLPLKS